MTPAPHDVFFSRDTGRSFPSVKRAVLEGSWASLAKELQDVNERREDLNDL